MRFAVPSTPWSMSSNAIPFEAPLPHHRNSTGKGPSRASAVTAGHHESTTSRTWLEIESAKFDRD